MVLRYRSRFASAAWNMSRIFACHATNQEIYHMPTETFTFFYIFVYTYTCNDMRSVMLQINEYDDDDDDLMTVTLLPNNNWQTIRSVWDSNLFSESVHKIRIQKTRITKFKKQKQDCDVNIESRPSANRTHTHAFLPLWPWPWRNNFELRRIDQAAKHNSLQTDKRQKELLCQ